MKIFLLLLFIFAPAALTGEKNKNYTQTLKKKVDMVDRIVIRNGGNTCCISAQKTLEQEVYKTITDKKLIKQLIDCIDFTQGREKNGCLCCGHPGIDWYVGEKRVLLSSWKHGYGLYTGTYVYYFTKKSEALVAQWLIDNKIPDKNKEFQKPAQKK